MHAKKRGGRDFSVDDLVNSINCEKKEEKGKRKNEKIPCLYRNKLKVLDE